MLKIIMALLELMSVPVLFAGCTDYTGRWICWQESDKYGLIS
jgi:hypothetical protein